MFDRVAGLHNKLSSFSLHMDAQHSMDSLFWPEKNKAHKDACTINVDDVIVKRMSTHLL